MASNRPLSGVIREALVAFLCGLVLISGLAQARIVRPAESAALQGSLCPASAAAGVEAPQNEAPRNEAPQAHDCFDCCLPRPVGLAGTPAALAARLGTPSRATSAPIDARAPGIITGLPGSRGPPAMA